MKDSIKIILFLFLTTSLFSLDIEYKTNNKERLFSTIKQITNFINNSGMVSKYEKDKTKDCKDGWEQTNNHLYCTKKKELTYTTIGNIVVLDNDDVDRNSRSKLKIEVYKNGYDPAVAPTKFEIVDLAETIKLKLDTFTSGNLTCEEEERFYPKDSNSPLPSDTTLNYFIVDIPSNNSDKVKNLLLSMKCKNIGKINNNKIETEEGTNDFLKQVSIREDNNNEYNTRGLESIPYNLDSIESEPNDKRSRVFFKDNNTLEIPIIIKYSPIKIKLSKTFYYPKGTLSDNDFTTNFNNGETTLVYRTTKYSELNEGSDFSNETNLDTRVFSKINECKLTMKEESKEVLNNKSKKTTYNMVFNYGNILTKYDTMHKLDVFNSDLLQKHIVDKYNLNEEVYNNFHNNIDYSIVFQRQDERLGEAEFSEKKKEIVYPTILPYIVSENYDASCSKIEQTQIVDKFVQAKLIITDNTGISKKKHIGLASKAYIEGLQSTTEESDNLVKNIVKNFKDSIIDEKLKINNYIDYSYEEEEDSQFGIDKIQLNTNIQVDLYKYQDDIFQQFIGGAELKTLDYTRTIEYTPVIIKLRHYNCN